MANLNKFQNKSEDIIQLFNNYTTINNYRIKLKLKEKTMKGGGIKILLPKKIFKRLSIALSQLQSGKTFDVLMDEIKEIVYLLYCTDKT